MRNYNKTPFVEVTGNFICEKGWNRITERIISDSVKIQGRKTIVAIEFYQGVLAEKVRKEIQDRLPDFVHFIAEKAMYDESHIRELVYPDVTDDRIFGYLTRLNLEDFFDPESIDTLRLEIENSRAKNILITGTGAALVYPEPDIFIYADMARWEIQLRLREHLADNIGLHNRATEDWMLLYKQGFFVDWRICDRFKKSTFNRWDFVLDTNNRDEPKLIEAEAVRKAFEQVVMQPFSVVPFFDPGPWGGQWMKEQCNLDKSEKNYAWCFNCVPEENSLLLKFGQDVIEVPSVNLVFFHPGELLGNPVHGRFGDEFPIRFDFLDTMGGGNLSLQVHPLTEYIQEKFGMHYTQDESYYLLDAGFGAFVFLGLKEGADVDQMQQELKEAQQHGKNFDAEKYVEKWPVKKHDHYLIPAGTIHCSGKDSMVLEISATPYIFTFKLWDWGRLGFDGKPRPINIEHGFNVIRKDRTTEWTRENLINRVEILACGEGWHEERTGLHECEFIETRRHVFSVPVLHDTGGSERGSVHVIALVEGEEVVIESPGDLFNSFILHYAEVCIIPAKVGKYTIRPHGPSEEGECITIKAYVRF